MVEVGFFKEHHGHGYAPFASNVLPEGTKRAVLDYMQRGNVIAAAPGIMRDAFDASTIPGEMLIYTDGEYIWGTEAMYYLEKRDLELPKEFVQKTLQ